MDCKEKFDFLKRRVRRWHTSCCHWWDSNSCAEWQYQPDPMPHPLLYPFQHHCRRCGRVCCASCCDTRMELPRMCFLDPVRLCSTCANTTLKEKIFFNQDIKVLMGGKCMQQYLMLYLWNNFAFLCLITLSSVCLSWMFPCCIDILLKPLVKLKNKNHLVFCYLSGLLHYLVRLHRYFI